MTAAAVFIGIDSKSGPASAVGGRGARGFLVQRMQPPLE